MSSSEFELTRSESTTQLWQQGKKEKFQENDQEQSSSSQQPSYPQQQQQQHSYPPQPYPPHPYPQSYPPPQPYPPQPYHSQQSYPPQPYYYSQQPYSQQQQPPPPQQHQQQQQAVVYNSQDDSCSSCSKSMVDCINSYRGITTMSYTMDCVTGGKYFPPVVGIYNTAIVPDGGAITTPSAATAKPPALPLPESKVKRLRLTPVSPEWGSLSSENQTALIGTRRKYGIVMFILMLVALALLAASGATKWLILYIFMGDTVEIGEIYIKYYSIFSNCWSFGTNISTNISPNSCKTGPNEVQLIIPFIFCCAFILGTLGHTFLVFRQSFGGLFVPIGGIGGFATILATIILFNQQTSTFEPDTNNLGSLYPYFYHKTEYKTGLTLAYCVVAFPVLVTLISLRLVQLEAAILFKAPKTQQEEEENDDLIVA